MNVLSTFDGMSCLRIALDKLQIPVTNYFASEIDKYAIQVSKANWNDVQHIGDVTKVKATDLPRIDLLAGGSPCQGFSFAGKQLNFEDPRSKLFFEFVRLKNELNPTWFFLENVVMKKEYQTVISEALGVQPILINSALVCAQNRKRLYWTNIPFFGQPEDRGIVLKDILENNFDCNQDKKSLGLFAGYRNNRSLRDYNKSQKQLIKLGNTNPCGHGMNGEVYSIEGKAPTLTTNKGEGNKIGQRTMIDQIASETKRDFAVSYHENGNIRPHKLDARKSGISEIGTICHPDNKCVTHISSHVPNVIIQTGNLYPSGGQAGRIYSDEGKSPSLKATTGGNNMPKIQQINPSKDAGGKQPYMQDRVYHPEFKSVCLTAGYAERLNVGETMLNYRKLTVTECERLQGIPDGYCQRLAPTAKQISNTQAYKMLGNGWQIDTIEHLLEPLKYVL